MLAEESAKSEENVIRFDLTGRIMKDNVKRDCLFKWLQNVFIRSEGLFEQQDTRFMYLTTHKRSLEPEAWPTATPDLPPTS